VRELLPARQSGETAAGLGHLLDEIETVLPKTQARPDER